MTDLFSSAKKCFCSTVSSQGEDPTSYKFTIDADETNQKVILTTKTNSFVTNFILLQLLGGWQGGGVEEGEEEAEVDGQDCDAGEELLHRRRSLIWFLTSTINH